MKLQTCFGDVYFLYTMPFLAIQKVYTSQNYHNWEEMWSIQKVYSRCV